MTVVVEFKPASMLVLIKTAKTNDELLALAVEAVGYKYASDKTRRKWDRAIQSRKVQLAKTVAEPETKQKPRAKIDRKGKRRGKHKDKS